MLLLVPHRIIALFLRTFRDLQFSGDNKKNGGGHAYAFRLVQQVQKLEVYQNWYHNRSFLFSRII